MRAPPASTRASHGRDALVGRAGSAGGLLIGAVANQAPELFRALVAEVPFVDCVTTMLDDELPLTVGEWEEWGNPAGRRGGLPPHAHLLPLRQRDRRGIRRARRAVPGPLRHGGPQRPPGRLLGAGQVGGQAAGTTRPRRGSLSRPSSAPATAGPRAATTPGGRRPWSTPSSSMPSAWGCLSLSRRGEEDSQAPRESSGRRNVERSTGGRAVEPVVPSNRSCRSTPPSRNEA